MLSLPYLVSQGTSWKETNVSKPVRMDSSPTQPTQYVRLVIVHVLRVQVPPLRIAWHAPRNSWRPLMVNLVSNSALSVNTITSVNVSSVRQDVLTVIMDSSVHHVPLDSTSNSMVVVSPHVPPVSTLSVANVWNVVQCVVLALVPPTPNVLLVIRASSWLVRLVTPDVISVSSWVMVSVYHATRSVLLVVSSPLNVPPVDPQHTCWVRFVS